MNGNDSNLGWHIDTFMQFYGGGWLLGLTSMLY